ncbi:MAG: di-trans,poly-cis-decaprenylcistransferase [SAR202 cluster bacterium]|nr:di-trans,poly-cis-decaprenylcistransferase [SAR202 cluster bacterium]
MLTQKKLQAQVVQVGVDHGAIPDHVAIIMDGNGRWASARSRPRTEGHRAGTGNVRRIVQHLARKGVKHVTLFAFSTENWERPAEEVSFLMELVREVIKTEVAELHRQGIRVRHLGTLDRLDPGFRQEIENAVALTALNQGMTLNVAFNYGGRDEIVRAVRRIVESRVPVEDVDEALVRRHLFCPELPDPDLMIRTGGEFRISNFLLFQSAYSEFYSTETNWPDFGPEDVDRALEAYARRQRRFGKVI